MHYEIIDLNVGSKYVIIWYKNRQTGKPTEIISKTKQKIGIY